MESDISMRVTEAIEKSTEEKMRTLKNDLVGSISELILQGMGQKGEGKVISLHLPSPVKARQSIPGRDRKEGSLTKLQDLG
jgi:hypothetical protein